MDSQSCDTLAISNLNLSSHVLGVDHLCNVRSLLSGFVNTGVVTDLDVILMRKIFSSLTPRQDHNHNFYAANFSISL